MQAEFCEVDPVSAILGQTMGWGVVVKAAPWLQLVTCLALT